MAPLWTGLQGKAHAAAESGWRTFLWAGGAVGRQGSAPQPRSSSPPYAGLFERLRAAALAECERAAALLRSASARAAQAVYSAPQSALGAVKSSTRAAAQAERDRAARLLRAASARLMQARQAVVPDVRTRLTALRNRLFGGALLLVFVYAVGSATPRAVAQYRLEAQRLEIERAAAVRARAGTNDSL